MHGYTFLLLTPFSFVKKKKKMIDELQLYVLKNIASAPGKPFLKSTTPQPPPSSPNFTSKEVDRSPHFENMFRGPWIYQAIIELKGNKI